MSTSITLASPKSHYLSLREPIETAIRKVLDRGNYVMGEEVEAFEAEWALYCKAKYCVGVSSCTDALFLALEAVGSSIVFTNKVITSPASFFATTQAIVQSGHLPQFMDIGLDENIDLGRADFPWTIALPVNLYGHPANIPERKKGQIIIEDAAQSHGIPLRGDIACHSFYPTKNLGAFGQAGSVVTNDKEIADKVRELRTYGERERFVHHALTGNFRMDEIQAAVLRVKLPYLEGWNSRRREIASLYRSRLDGLNELGLTLPVDHPQHVYHIYSIRTERRDDLARFLSESGIQTSVRYPYPIHLQPALSYLNFRKGDFPEAEAWARENLSLPMDPFLQDDEIEYVCMKVKEWSLNLKEI